MRFLGLDYGTKRVGAAISDENFTLAFPKDIFPNDKNLFENIEKVIKEENISEIVVGESMDLSGKANPVQAQIETFISELKNKTGLMVHTQKEFLTSVEARRYDTGAERADASAAALILQRYLDKYNQK